MMETVASEAEWRGRAGESSRRLEVSPAPAAAPGLTTYHLPHTTSPDSVLTPYPLPLTPSRFRFPLTASRSRAGFTLIELLIVMSLIALLAAMAVVQYRNSVRRSEEAVLKTNLFRVRDAIDQYYADKGKYPASLESLVSDGYLRAVPDDPITKSRDTWQTVPAEPDPGNPSADPGIYDVKSGAPGQALDGSSYADW